MISSTPGASRHNPLISPKTDDNLGRFYMNLPSAKLSPDFSFSIKSFSCTLGGLVEHKVFATLLLEMAIKDDHRVQNLG